MQKIEEITNNYVSYNNLAHEYLESLKDEKFKNLVSDIPLPDEEKMKYTSSLMDSSIEYNNCKACKNLATCKNKETGYCYLPRVSNDHIIFEYRICKYLKKLKNETDYLKNIYTFDISEEIKNAKIKNLYTDDSNRVPAIKWCLNFIKDYPKETKGLYLHGNFGCGKTYLVSATFSELASKNIKSAIIFWPEFLRNLKSNLNEFNEKFEKIKRVPLLLIDDIGAETTTSWERDEVLSPLLQHRMQNHMPTFFTSNLTLEELEKHLSISKDSVDIVKSRRIIERIKQLTIDIELISKNLRN